MPIYEYACKSCGHRFEKKQSFSDEPLAVCPECGEQVQRVLHPAGIIFKGSGWYVTDSRKGSGSDNGSGTKSDAAGASAEGSKSAAKSAE